MSDTDQDTPDLPPAADNAGKVPSLDSQQRYGGGRRRAQLDDDIERELQEARGGQNIDQMLADDPQRRKQEAGAPPGKLKGRVISIHVQDVFLAVPGGRSQGVLPLQQFPDGPPKIGDEIEVTIE